MQGGRVYGGRCRTPARSVSQVWRARERPSMERRQALRLCASSSSIPHPNKNGEGEDAYFVTPCGSCVGVADGVGGWAKEEIDAGEYSRELCDRAARFVANTGETRPVRIMQKAFDESCAVGSSTFCCVAIQNDELRVANLGDSGFLLFRPSEEGLRFLFQSTEQQHYFNCPRQLGSRSLDMPSDADKYEMKVREGDIVIVGSDGLFDNLKVEEVIAALEGIEFQPTQEELQLTHAANVLATAAFEASQTTTGTTPFARSARQHGFKWAGGKLDDITVVVAVVSPIDDRPKEPATPRNPAADFYLPPSVFGEAAMDTQQAGSPDSAYASCASLSPGDLTMTDF